MKRIVIDFEFYPNNAVKAEIIDFSALFCDGEKVVDEIVEKVIIDKKYEECSKAEIDALKFNNINSQEDIIKHNKGALKIESVLERFLNKSKNFSNEKLGLSGWNNASADNVILRRYMDSLGYDFNEYFDYHTRDVMCAVQVLYEKTLKKEGVAFHLKDMHMALFGNIKPEEFHEARTDCIATLDVALWYEREIEKYVSCKK